MSQENKKIIEDVNSLLVNGSSKEHVISASADGILKVWVKELSFLETQEAIKEVVSMTTEGEVEIDLAGYWKYMLMKCIERTEPSISHPQLLALKPEIGTQITALLPQPQDLMTGPLEGGPTG